MKQLKILAGALIALLMATLPVAPPAALAQDMTVARPKEIDDVLNNPGKGFTTFQRFNGDTLNVAGEGWTEGFPIEYQEFDGSLENKGYPETTIAYFRIYWKFVEPKKGQYNWDIIDKALKTAHERGQRLLLRIAPYGGNDERKDVPDWYREMVGEKSDWPANWQVDAEDPRYVKHFGGLIRALGRRYDGHPDLQAVDGSIVGPWGEGAGSELLSEKTRRDLVGAYVETFDETPVIMLLTDEKTNTYALSKSDVGWRVDCLGDLGIFEDELDGSQFTDSSYYPADGWNHMYNYYPRGIIEYGVEEAWKKAPVSLEICYTFTYWKEQAGFDLEEVNYVFDQALKWHLSSFNAKSSPVPEAWRPAVDRWLKKMGYRFVLRQLSYPKTVAPGGKLRFTSWWENKGVAPIYRQYPLAFRLRNEEASSVLLTEADVRAWMPGDNLYDGAVFVPRDLPAGEYQLELALVEPLRELDETPEPAVKLAIEGRTEDGWYSLGKITVQK